jgi:hypothetical protein
MQQMEIFPTRNMPDWLPDEPLFSLVNRYHGISGNNRMSATCKQLFGKDLSSVRIDFPGRLSEFARRTHNLLGNSTEIVQQHTILPFYLRFRSESDASIAANSMLGDSLGALKYRLGLRSNLFRENHPLKSCLKCMSADIAEHSTAYWHLSHQYPGIWYCPIHDTPLLASPSQLLLPDVHTSLAPNKSPLVTILDNLDTKPAQQREGIPSNESQLTSR